jgi:outer membrane autotransporter protein
LFNVDELVKGLRQDERGIAINVFQPFAIESADPTFVNNFKSLVLKNLEVDKSNFAASLPSGLGYGEIAYNKNTGNVVFADYYGDADYMKGVPKYGVPYLEALDKADNRDLAIYIKGMAKVADVSDELNALMGNVPNAALAAALSDNMNQVMGHLNSTLSPTMPGFAGPAGAANGLWIIPGYSMTDISGSPQEGYGSLEIKNPAVTLGYDRAINERIRLGVFAAMSQPESEGDYETIKSDNLQAGLYGQAQLNYGLTVNAAVAYSQQSHDAERDIPNVFGLGYNQMVNASFNSNALSAAVEVSRLYPVAQNAFVRPTIGYSYVAASVDGYEEQSKAGPLRLAQKTEDADFTMHLLRVGAEGGWSNNLTTVTGRLFWVGNLGDTQPKTQASLITDGSVPFTLVGAEYDKNMVNIGLSAQYTPPQTKGLTFGLNYDALLGSNAKSHNVSLMMRYEF